MGKLVNMKGKKFERLTVNCLTGTRDIDGRLEWECTCKCGKTKITTRHALRNKFVKSCGCFKSDSSRNRMLKINQKRKEANPNAKDLLKKVYQEIKSGSVSKKTIHQIKSFLENRIL